MIDSVFIFFLFLAVLPVFKWFAIVLLIPFQTAKVYYNRKGGLLPKLLCVPYVLVERLCRGGWLRYMLYHISTIPSNSARCTIYKLLGAKIGKKVVIHYKTEIRDPFRLSIGQGTIIGDNAILDARRELVIGNNVNFSSNVSVYTLQHDYTDPYFRCKPSLGRVVIGDRVWLGSNVIVLPGITIGEGAVCCAGCVVTKDVLPFQVVAGIPAKVVNIRPNNLLYEFNGKSCWFY